MSAALRTAVTGVGSYLPDEVLTNQDLAKIVDTSDAWIFERTGIHERRRAAPDQAVSDLAVEAARKALAAAGRTAEDLDLIIVATTTPDLTFPATAAIGLAVDMAAEKITDHIIADFQSFRAGLPAHVKAAFN